MDGNNSQPRTLSDLVGDTKLRRRFTKETVRRNVPVKEEALIRTVLKSNTMRSMAAGDPEAQSHLTRYHNLSSHVLLAHTYQHAPLPSH